MELRVLETHVSWLILTGEHAYKVKKPVRLDFIDLTDPQTRVQACHAEVDLNRRLAPDVYVGVGAFEDPTGRVEPVVVMRQLPADTALSRIVLRDDPDVGAHVDAVAHVLARFHRTAVRSADIDAACTAPAVSRLWRRNAEGLRQVAGTILSPSDLDAADQLAGRYLAERDPAFDRRIRDRRAVDGHGDLLADDVFSSHQSVNILDCLEFDSGLRHVDTLLDLASLATDLERHGRPDLARRLLDTYREASEDAWPASLAHFYMAYRAMVRAKVACIRAASAPPEARSSDEAEARTLLAIARRHLSAAQTRLVLVGGLPGTGKTTLAHRVAEETGWDVLSSDTTRKRLAGPGADFATPARFEGGLYSPHITDRVYAQLLREADGALREGRSVIIDASWSWSHLRRAAAATASRAGADLHQVRCTAPRAVAAGRIVERRVAGRTASDATPEIADAMAARFDPWPGSVPVDTSAEGAATVARVLAALGWSPSVTEGRVGAPPTDGRPAWAARDRAEEGGDEGEAPDAPPLASCMSYGE